MSSCCQLVFASVIVFVCHIHLSLQFLRLFMSFPIDITQIGKKIGGYACSILAQSTNFFSSVENASSVLGNSLLVLTRIAYIFFFPTLSLCVGFFPSFQLVTYYRTQFYVLRSSKIETVVCYLRRFVTAFFLSLLLSFTHSSVRVCLQKFSVCGSDLDLCIKCHTHCVCM